MGIFTLIMGCLALFATAQDIDNSTFIDETGKRFDGKTDTLEFLTVMNFRSRCSDLRSGPGVIAWDQVLKSSDKQEVSSYGIRFEVYDRKATHTFGGGFKWDRKVWKDNPGYVTRCEGSSDPNLYGISLPPNVSLKYAEIHFWITKIVLETVAPTKPVEDNDRQAFTIEDQLKKGRKHP